MASAIPRRNHRFELYLSENANKATIAIRDFGPGVPEMPLTRIFDPFFRVEEARNTNGGGSGLGLSIAKRAVHLHRGSSPPKMQPRGCVSQSRFR